MFKGGGITFTRKGTALTDDGQILITKAFFNKFYINFKTFKNPFITKRTILKKST